MNWIAILAVLVATGFAILYWASRPLYYRGVNRAGLRRFLDTLFEACKPGSFTVMQHESSPAFVQVALNSVSGPIVRFEFGVPRVAWTAPSYDAIGRAAESRGFAVISEEGAGNQSVSGFMRITGQAPDKDAPSLADAWAQELIDLLGLPSTATFTVHTEGMLSGPRARALAKSLLREIAVKKGHVPQ